MVISARMDEVITKAMTSRVAMARMSAHETLFLHLASTAFLAFITVSNPSPARERLSGWSFSALLLPAEATMTEPSHPWAIQLSQQLYISASQLIKSINLNF